MRLAGHKPGAHTRMTMSPDQQRFADRVHAMACARIARAPDLLIPPAAIEVMINNARAIDNVIAEYFREHADPSQTQAMTIAPGPEALAAEYARGFEAGRANPWRAMSQLPRTGHVAIAWCNSRFSDRVLVCVVDAEKYDGAHQGDQYEIGWLPLPTVAK